MLVSGLGRARVAPCANLGKILNFSDLGTCTIEMDLIMCISDETEWYIDRH